MVANWPQKTLEPFIDKGLSVVVNSVKVVAKNSPHKLLGMDQKTLNAMRGNWPPKTLKPFTDNRFTMRGNFVEVIAKSSLW
ncbi:MAG: hypothetical protein DRR08_17050 [Candidatus Parabeggiatoa sp. nov. 2]|nr:MAG: hypothetical protein B6247_17990 [Beggiatoa sp. 4572_84]RKZ58202.1 MAG: hypothetical protein DRR08_17050 [Gammaproteobacteria bacterium]